MNKISLSKLAAGGAGCILLTAGLTGCGHSGASVSAAGLSPQLKAQLDQTAANVAKATQWQSSGQAQHAAGAGAVPTAMVEESAAMSLGAFSKADQGAPDPGLEKLRTDVGAMCQIQETPAPGNSQSSLDFGLKVSGPTCPVNFSFDFQLSTQATGNSSSATVKFAMDYDPVGDEAKKALDIQDYHLALSGNTKSDANGMNSQGQLTGNVVSVSQGNIKISGSFSMSGNTNGGQSVQQVTLTYPNATSITLKEVDMGNGQTKSSSYSINGTPVDKDTFNSYLKDFGFDKAGGQQAQASRSPTQNGH